MLWTLHLLPSSRPVLLACLNPLDSGTCPESLVIPLGLLFHSKAWASLVHTQPWEPPKDFLPGMAISKVLCLDKAVLHLP